MKSHPILFSAPMVHAILAGNKTQTRRIVKPQPSGEVRRDVFAKSGFSDAHGTPISFRYAVGERLWVRETWGCSHAVDHLKPSEIPHLERVHYAATSTLGGSVGLGGLMTRVSIHMPRWASRIELEVTAVRIERIKDISEADAVAEGARRFDDIPIGTPFKYGNPCRWSMDDAPPNTDHCLSSARYAFGNIWERIHGHGSWDANPFVWVYEFKVVG